MNNTWQWKYAFEISMDMCSLKITHNYLGFMTAHEKVNVFIN